MSLIEDLQSLDVSAIVNARASLTAALNNPDIGNITQSGGAGAALGELGRGLEQIQADFPAVEELFNALLEALGNLAPRLDASGLPIADLTSAVREGATMVSSVFRAFNESPASWGADLGHGFGDALQLIGGKAGDVGKLLGEGADALPQLFRMVDNAPSDPRALAHLAIDLLLPFPRQNLVTMRDGVRLITSGVAGISLPAGRTSGLAAAFDVVAREAASGDAARLEAALRELDRARRQTIATLQDDLRFVAEQMARLRIPQVLNPIAEAGGSLRAGSKGVIEFISDLGQDIARIRFQVENFDLDPVREYLNKLPDLVESTARKSLEQPIDQMVARVKQVLREIFRKLPVREYRAVISRFLHDIAVRIDEANLDGPANQARNALQSVSQFLTSNSLAGEVQQELQRLNTALSGVLDGIEAPLNQIADAVDSIANTAVSILDRVATALDQFQQAIDQLQAAVENLGISEAREQIVAKLQQLRQAAEDLLSNVPLPEQLRPPIEQLIAELEGIDLDELMQPVRDVAAEIGIPEDVKDVVDQALIEAKRVIDNLIPQQLIDSISAEVEQALASVRSFNPASMIPDLSGYLEQAAGAVEKLDPRQIAEEIRGPFQTVLDIVDRANPFTLLAPVIQAYDSLLDAVPVPNPVPAGESIAGTLDSVGRVAGRALVEPAARLSPEAQPEIGDPDRPQTIEQPANAGDIRPGDAIRLLGYVPSKLREILRAIDAGPVGEVMDEIDSLCGGLARELRQVSDALAAIERRIEEGLDAMFIPVTAAQARAQLALHANVQGASLTVSLDAVAAAGPVNLRRDMAASLVSTRLSLRGAIHAAGGNVRLTFDRAANALETSPLATLTGDLDRFLAALDPEPIALEVDLLMSAVVQKVPDLIVEIGEELKLTGQRLRAIVSALNPIVLAQRFLTVFDDLRAELDILNPRRLAAELAEIHAAIRSAIEAYDPRLIAADLFQIVTAVSAQIRALNPTELLGNLDFWQATIDRAEQLNPAVRLQAIGEALKPIGERLAAIDLDALIDTINALPPLLTDEFEALIEALRNEIVALLESLRFATGSASASASVSVG